MAVITNGAAPYAPPSAILGIIERYRNRGLQTPFTADVISRAGISDSLVARTLQALRNLDLIDEGGNPTETMQELSRCPEQEFKGKLAGWIKKAYADVFAFVDAADSEARIRDAFRHYTPRTQADRMVTLFLALCRTAGLRPDEPAKDRRHRQNPQRRRAGKMSAHLRLSKNKGLPNTDALGLPPAITGLLTSLPNQKEGWTEDTRDSFLKTFAAVLNFCYPIRNPDEDSDAEEES